LGFVNQFSNIHVLNRTPYRKQIPATHMGVNLCRAGALVPQQLLNIPDVVSCNFEVPLFRNRKVPVYKRKKAFILEVTKPGQYESFKK